MLEDDTISTLLIRLDKNIKATWKEMVSIGIVRECTECAMTGGGSCCGAGIENKYNSALLLINLLIGITLPQKPHDATSCYFLNSQGCILRARHVLCVNYLCKRIYKTIHHVQLVRLQHIAGEELDTLFILEEQIKKKLRTLS